MTHTELINALRRLKIQTNSIACLGCGHEHNCGIHGCAIIREAAEKLGDFKAVFNEDAVVKLAGRCLKVEPGRLRELAEADKNGRVVVLPCKVGDALYRTSPSGVVVHRVANVVYRGLTSRWYIDTIPNLPYASEELGKTTFLTREAAEEALEALKDE